MSATVTPLKPDIGVEIAGVRGASFTDSEVADECRVLLDRHGVVVYREAHVDDAEFVAFSHLLGSVQLQPRHSVPNHPEIAVVSVDPDKSLYAGVQRGTFAWHIDGTTEEYPNKSTLLTCREVPQDGSGDTEFATTYAAYDALSDDEKVELDGLEVEYGYANDAHRNAEGISEQGRAIWEQMPMKARPLVWSRRDGRRSMLLGSTATRVVGWTEERSRELLDRLLEWSTQPQFVVRHQWALGDLVVFDNTGLLHRALPYETSSRRLMHRTTLIGDETVA